MDIQLTQILFQLVNFTAVLGALTYLLYKPILKIFDERSRRIHEGQKAAEEALATRENLEEMKKEAKTALKRERTQLLKEAQEEADKQKELIISEARKQAKMELEKSKDGWRQEKAQLLKDSKAEMSDAVLLVAEKLVGEHLSSASDQKLIDRELNAILKSL